MSYCANYLITGNTVTGNKIENAYQKKKGFLIYCHSLGLYDVT